MFIKWRRELTLATAVLVLAATSVAAGDPDPIGAARRPKVERDWASLIDATWGPGPSIGDQLEVFDTAWTLLDEEYGAYMNLDVDMVALREHWRPEIAAGVSLGRLVAIINHLSMAMLDAHTVFVNRAVNWGTSPDPGVPLFVVGAWLDASRFGAALTPLPDGSLLVIRTAEHHVLGLEPGDVVLGYDGLPWKEIYRQLLEAELPIRLQWVWGSTPESMEHCLLMSAGQNWHLFETIDIHKHRTNETVHLPTAPLASQQGRVWGNEQLAVPGVPMPDFWNEDFVSYGIVEGTNIGYIYVASWSWEARHQISEQFYEAIYSMMYEHQTSGLILDFRLNTGGTMQEAHSGYTLLFDRRVAEVGFDVRGDPHDHLDMIPDPTGYYTVRTFTFRGHPSSFYDRPIAVLTGPGAVSNGDWESQRTRFHPMVRTFGKPSNGAFTISQYPDAGPSWWVTYAHGSGYLVDGHVYMSHTGVQPHYEVWLTREDVIEGRDTVVEEAIRWIHRAVPRRPQGRAGANAK